MIKLIEQKIKELYGKKETFCKQQGYKYKDFASKLRTVENRFNWLNKFLEPLNLKVKMTSKVKPTYLEIGLRAVGITFDMKTIGKIIDLFELIEEKKDFADVDDVCKLQAKWDK